MHSKSPKKKSSRIWKYLGYGALGLLIVVVALAVVGWMKIDGYVKSNVETQLTDLDLGNSSVSSVSILPSGVVAHDIEFHLSPDDPEPWLSVGELVIDHPLKSLIAGAENFKGLELNGATIRVDLDEALEDGAAGQFDVSELQLPAEEIRVRNATVILRQTGKSDLVIQDIDASIRDGDQIQVDGSIGAMAGGEWTIGGNVVPAANTYQLELKSESLAIDSQQWSQWPLVPDNLEQIITADGHSSATITIKSNGDEPIAIDGKVSIGRFQVTLPDLNFPFELESGDVQFGGDQVKFNDLVAVLPDGGTIKASGQTHIDRWPLKSTFSGQFTQVPSRTWRNLVTAIPEVFNAESAGKFNGSVLFEASTRTVTNLSATATASAGRYADIVFKNATAEIKVIDLIFDERQQWESIDGEVTLNANATKQNVRNVFQTFELGEVQQLLAIDGNGTGQMELTFPLATAEDLKTWEMAVEAEMPRGKFADQRLNNVQLTAKMSDGNLRLDPVTALATGESKEIDPAAPEHSTSDQNKIQASLRWPMVSNVPDAETARIGLTTGDVSPAWLQRALDTLIRNAVGPENSAETTDLAEHLTGAVNTTGHITISTLSPEDIGQWDAVIEIKDSDIAFDESRFSELAAAISLADSRLTFSQVTADAGSGDVSANGFLGLDNINRHQVELDVSSMDFNWLTELAQNLDESDLISLGNNDGNVATLADVQERVDGVLDFRWKMTSEPDRDDPSTANWQANLVGGSEMLTFYGVELNRLGVRLSADQQQIQVSELELALDEKATVRGEGTWQFENNSGSGSIHWQDLSLETIQAMAVVDGAGSGEPVETGGEQQMIPVHGVTAGQVNLRWPVQPSQPTETASMDSVAGTISFRNMEIASFKPKPFRFDIQSDWNNLVLTNFATDDERLNLELKTTVQAEPPYDYDVSGTMKDLALSEFFETSSVVEEEGLTTELTGAAAGQFRIRGTLSPFDWQSNGKLIILSPTVNREAFSDVTVAWERLGSDTKKSRLQIDALGGKMQMVEMSQKPERVRVEISAIDATELTTLFELPVDLTGKLDGDASINDWSLSETRWFDLKLRGSSMVVGQAELGDFQAQAEYRNKQASYGVEGTLLSGKLTGSGETELKLDRLADARFPLDLKLTNVALADLYGESNAFRSLRPLAGSLSATAEFEFPVGELPSGSGRMSVGELKWEQELITREASVRWKINQDRVVLDDVKVDLKRGSVAARASLPIRGGAPGNYDIDIRQLDLKRLTEVWLGDDWEAEGLLDARLSGQLGKTINGQGYVGVDQARVQGVAGQSVRVPVRYRLSPSSSSGRIELRRSRFRLFGGNVSGKADLDFGSRMDLSVDLELSKVNSGEMIQSLFDIDDVDQGQLSGRLKLNGRGIRSARDLEGSFQGSLDRAEAFQLPVLEQIGKFLSTGGLMNREYDSDKIDLRLNRGRIEVRRLNFHNSLARIAINGDVHLDGRLDLSVAAQVDQLNQPTLVEELAGSPLAGLGGNPAAFFASAADFLSNRIVFLRVGGTFARPQVRLDSPQQLREEAVRYFLQNSPLLPASIGRNPNN